MGNRSGELVVKINVEGTTTIEKLETIIKKISEIKRGYNCTCILYVRNLI